MILGGLTISATFTTNALGSGGGGGGGTKGTAFVFNVFWDTEMVVNRYDTTSTTTETTARGWFFR
jgi:hypothetical protein